MAVGLHRAVDGPTQRGDVERLVEVGVLGGAPRGRPVGLEVLATREVREEAGALDERTDTAEHRGACRHRLTEHVHRAGVRPDEALTM